MRPLYGIAAGALALTIATPPTAASPDDRAFSVSLNYAHFDLGEDLAPHGGLLGADYERGLSETISLRASGGVGLYYEDALSYSGHATVGITYLFDVLKWVPYANLGVGAIFVDGTDQESSVNPLIELGFGVDFLRSREFSWGLQARYETYIDRTRFITAGVRATWRWGFF